MRIVLAGTLWGLAALVASYPASAQPYTITPLVVEGDVIPGVGNVVSISNLVVNDAGDWIVEVDTDHANTDADVVLVRNGVVLLREGGLLAAPAGSRIGVFDSITLNANGDSGWNFGLDGPPSGQDSGVYYNTTLVVQEGTASTAPEFTPGTPYIGFFDVKINDLDVMSVLASLDDPGIPSSVDQALVRVVVDSSGVLLSEEVVAMEGDVPAGQTETIEDFGTGPHESGLNDAGQILYFADLAGDSSEDGAVYLDADKLLQEKDPSPVPFRRYEILSSRGMSLNNAGDWVAKTNLDGDATTDELIVRNGAKFVQEGDSIPAIAPFTFAGSSPFGIGSGPVIIDDSRNVLWFGDWDDTSNDTGLFLNTLMLAQEGVTMIGGQPIDSFYAGSDGFAMSDNGRFVIFEANLPGNVNGAFLVEVVAPSPVPDGNVISGTQATASLATNGDIELTWDATTCPADDYHLMVGNLVDVASLAYTGAVCNLGPSGSASLALPNGNLFWIIVGTDAANRESSHGYNSTGAPRDASAGGACAVEVQILASSCPI